MRGLKVGCVVHVDAQALGRQKAYKLITTGFDK